MLSKWNQQRRGWKYRKEEISWQRGLGTKKKIGGNIGNFIGEVKGDCKFPHKLS